MKDTLKGYAVQPKLDCPHLKPEQVDKLCQFLLTKNTKHFSQFECAICKDKTQNWVCLQCFTVACSRFVQSHMVEHHDQTNHPIVLSFSDSSFWCYECDSYICHPSLIKARNQFTTSKFSDTISEDQAQAEKVESELLEKEVQKLKVNEIEAKTSEKPQIKKEEKEEQVEQKVTYEQIINNLKEKKYSKILFLTGAGLSVAAGIPDFRTPGTGLYDQLSKFNLPTPESIFNLNYFLENPLPFIKLAKEWSASDFNPTLGHKFINKINDENMLLYCITQNIDGLEIKAGVPEDKLLQAHGHSRTAHCTKCKREQSIEQWRKFMEKEEPMKCKDPNCNSLVKPDIVFFGQQLPAKFLQSPQIVNQADLVFVIGTSLAVWPFAFLAHMVPLKVPLILINNEDSLSKRGNKLWMSGDIQQNIDRICKDLNWNL